MATVFHTVAVLAFNLSCAVGSFAVEKTFLPPKAALPLNLGFLK